MKRLLIAMVKFYRKNISPWRPPWRLTMPARDWRRESRGFPHLGVERPISP